MDSTKMDCGLERVASTAPGQWLYLLGEEGIVYSERHNRFAGLDAAGVAAYRAFNAGAGIQDLRALSNQNILCSASGNSLEPIYALSQGIFPAEEPRTEWPARVGPVHANSAAANIEINGIPVLLEYPDGPLAEHCRDYFRHCPASTLPARCHLKAQPAEDGWTVSVNGRQLLSSLRDEQVGLGLLHAARSLLYAESEYDVAFHAAMVADGDRGILLCAPREAGKSTLAARLISQGYELLTDEPALLHLDRSSVSSFQLPISLKEGSWAMLLREWPQLASAPIHARADGTKIRLLHPPQARRSPRSRRLTQIVFPSYGGCSEAHVERLSPFRTLSLLNEGGLILAGHIGRDTFEEFMQLICRVPAYTVQYSSLQTGWPIIDTLPAG
jgi:hypothetical protein